MAVINVKFIDQAYLQIETDYKVEKDIARFFRFDTEQAKFRRRNRDWDGVWRLYYSSDRKLLAGLYPRLEEFAEKHGHKIRTHHTIGKDRRLFGTPVLSRTRIDEKEFRQWLDGLRYESKPQEHEATAMLNVLRRNRAMLHFSDGNKHPVLYCLLQWFLKEGKKCLLVAWNPEAVEELYERFGGEHVQKLYNRLTKNVKKPILIASWQSIYKQPDEWFDRFEAVIVDELDKFPAKASGPRTVIVKNLYKPVTKRNPQLQILMEKITKAKYRIGVTEWNGEAKIHPMLLEGLFGLTETIRDEASVEEPQASLNVTCLLFDYPKDIREQAKNWRREQEVEFLERYEWRNCYIRDLACALKGNTLVIVKKSSHRNVVYNLIHEKLQKKGLKKTVYMNARPTTDEWIVVATYQKIHYGLHVDCLDNVILSPPCKNDIRSLKSIGGNLESRNAVCNLYDLVDDLRLENWKNHLIIEASRRVKVYRNQELLAKIVRVYVK